MTFTEILSLSNASYLAVGPDGNIYVAYSLTSPGTGFTSAIAQVSPDGTVLSAPWAGSATLVAVPGVDGTGSAARFSIINGMKWANDGNLYVCDFASIRKVTSGAVVTTLSGSLSTAGYVNGNAGASRYDNPTNLTQASDNALYVVDSNNFVIRKVTLAGVSTLVCGNQGVNGFVNGTGAVAEFELPWGIVVDTDDVLYITDGQGTPNRVVRVSTLAGVVTTLSLTTPLSLLINTLAIDIDFNNFMYLGGGFATPATANVYSLQSNGDNSLGGSIATIGPTGIAFDNGLLYVADGINGKVYVSDVYGASGLYKLTTDSLHDTLLVRGSPVTTENVKIPNPSFKTGYVGG